MSIAAIVDRMSNADILPIVHLRSVGLRTCIYSDDIQLLWLCRDPCVMFHVEH